MRTALTRAIRVLADCLGPSTRRTNASASRRGGAHRRNCIRKAVTAVLEPLEQRALMSVYYVSPFGSDNNNGTSTSTPWRTVSKVSSTHLNPGDWVRFQGGQTFSGSLRLTGDGGSDSNRVVITSYGSGRATINSGTSNGAWSLNSTGITFDSLVFVGSTGDTGSQDGIRIENYTANDVRSGFTVNNCDISGFAQGGIVFGSDGSNEGLNNISLTNNNIYNNEMVGIESYSVTNQTNTNVTISNNLVHDNYGDGKSTVTGSGIMLQGLNGAMVEYNSAYNNGERGGNGGVGIWCYSSNDVIFQYNASYNNYGLKNDDGDGFDFDADTSNSIMQYNYAANNYGGGFQLNQWWNDNNETNDIIRYNISQDNGRRNNYSDIDVWGKVLNAQIYNNTCYNTTAVTGQTSDLRISNNETNGLYASNVRIANNIFVTTGNTPLVTVYAAALKGMQNIEFTGNVYYSYNGAPKFAWGSTTYSSFSSWQSGTGQEKLSGKSVGAYVNPQLANPGGATAPASATNLSSISAYDLLSNSPIVNEGVDLNDVLTLASPLTGSSGKTVPGVDQHFASLISGSASSSSSGSSSTGSSSTANGTVGKSYLSGYDIGNPNAGSNSESGSTNTIIGGGAGIAGTSDSFRYAFTTLTGNGQIVAQISSLSDSSSLAEAGVMVRSTDASNSAEVSLMLNNAGNSHMLSRSVTGGSTTNYTKADSGDKWIKLVRIGNTFSTYFSSNGSTWTLVGSTSAALGTSIQIGLATTSASLKATETAVFKNVSVSGTVS